MQDVLDLIRRAIAERRQLKIGVVNAAKLVSMVNDDSLAADVSGSDIVLADGMSVVWASLLLEPKLPERVAGIDLMQNILGLGRTDPGLRVFLLGASEQVNEKTAQVFAENYPGVVIAGRHHGYFSEDEEGEVVSAIADSRSDVLFVAMSSPLKERFMAQWYTSMNVPVVHGVGGSFDVVSGVVRRAPASWQRLGLEWLYRLLQEPRRLFFRYWRTNSRFIYLVLRQWALGS